jgi:hypothetical protein
MTRFPVVGFWALSNAGRKRAANRNMPLRLNMTVLLEFFGVLLEFIANHL